MRSRACCPTPGRAACPWPDFNTARRELQLHINGMSISGTFLVVSTAMVAASPPLPPSAANGNGDDVGGCDHQLHLAMSPSAASRRRTSPNHSGVTPASAKYSCLHGTGRSSSVADHGYADGRRGGPDPPKSLATPSRISHKQKEFVRDGKQITERALKKNKESSSSSRTEEV